MYYNVQIVRSTPKEFFLKSMQLKQRGETLMQTIMGAVPIH